MINSKQNRWIYALIGCFSIGLFSVHAQAAATVLSEAAGDFLSPDQAFILTEDHAADRVTLLWQIAPDYSLYKDKITIASQTADVKVTQPLYQTASVMHDDPEFGVVPVFQNMAVADVRIQTNNPAIKSAQLKVSYQGCANKGLCYPPITKIMRVPVMMLPKTATGQVRTAIPADEPKDDFQMDLITERPSSEKLAERRRAASLLASDAERIMHDDLDYISTNSTNTLNKANTPVPMMQQSQIWHRQNPVLAVLLSLLLCIAAVFCRAFDTAQTAMQRVQKGLGLFLFCSAVVVFVTALV